MILINRGSCWNIKFAEVFLETFIKLTVQFKNAKYFIWNNKFKVHFLYNWKQHELENVLKWAYHSDYRVCQVPDFNSTLNICKNPYNLNLFQISQKTFCSSYMCVYNNNNTHENIYSCSCKLPLCWFISHLFLW